MLHSVPSVESKADCFTSPPLWPSDREVYFILTPLRIRHDRERIGIPILIVCRDIKKDGTKTVPLRRPITPEVTTTIPKEADRILLSKVAKNEVFYSYSSNDCSKFLLNPDNYDTYLPLLCGTKRCFFEPFENRYHLYTLEDTLPLKMDVGPAWSLSLQWETQGKYLMAKVFITRNSERIEFEDLPGIYPGDEAHSGVFVRKNLISHFMFDPIDFSWIKFFVRRKKQTVLQSKWESIAEKLMEG